MTTVKIKFRASTVSGKPGSLYYQVYHRRVVRMIFSGFRVAAGEWDERRGRVIVPEDLSPRAAELKALQAHLLQDCCRLSRIVAALERQGGEYRAKDVVIRFCEEVRKQPFREFMCRVIRQLDAAGQKRTSETYVSALRSFMGFCGTADVRLDDIDADLMAAYEGYLKRKGLTLNTVSFYMRILRATYNRAVDRRLTVQRNPFRTVYTGVERTRKRAVPLQVIRQLKVLKLDGHPLLDFSRDMFLFSFYTRGMAFIDMAFLRRKNLQDGVLAYRRRKTGQCLYIKWEPCMQEIVRKYASAGAPYLLPIIRREENEREQYRNVQHLVNRKLKVLSAMLRLPVGLTMYCARHSWASIARNKNIPLSIISEGMGHESEHTTKIYLASLDHSVIDKANEKILSSL